MKIILSLFTTVILLMSCEPRDTKNSHKIVTVVNKTNKTLYITKNLSYLEVSSYKMDQDPL